ncbi:MAG: hypothetical protein PHR68_03120, partial [Candidatus Gracilibacteria bacterium]|nr:hypothetical protein [Candidatus Gracilibacteria bacterium]
QNIVSESNCITDNSFIKTNILVNGMFLDNNGTGDYLKYDISDLSLSGSDFAIEMSVRGAALKRSSGYPTLFTLTDNSTNNLCLAIYDSTNIVLQNCSTYTIYRRLIMSSITLSSNDFYKVIVNFNQNDIKFSINSIESEYINSYTYSNKNFLFIGSTQNKDYQWNDIIDYVKIYKR